MRNFLKREFTINLVRLGVREIKIYEKSFLEYPQS
jgi:hypothetical protein